MTQLNDFSPLLPNNKPPSAPQTSPAQQRPATPLRKDEPLLTAPGATRRGLFSMDHATLCARFDDIEASLEQIQVRIAEIREAVARQSK